jgi:hypothetical protein
LRLRLRHRGLRRVPSGVPFVTDLFTPAHATFPLPECSRQGAYAGDLGCLRLDLQLPSFIRYGKARLRLLYKKAPKND